MDKATVCQVEMELRHGALAMEMRFAVSAGWTVLFGPSGSGKSTVLRAIAGLVRPERGRIFVREEEVYGPGVWVPPHRRRVRSAGQQAWLFPGQVRENVAYGAGGAEVEEVLALLRLSGMAEARVERLSGGERQRVSVARAVAAAALGGKRAELLLLDEPFGGMDAGLRDALALELRDWLASKGVPVMSVTHDVGEAFLLGAEVIRVEGGRVVAQGPVGEVLREERERLREVLG